MEKIRPSFENIYMKFAVDLSARSTCKRLQVGCVIVSADYSYVYGIGYNGSAKGLNNNCDRDEAGNCGCLHAEENALLKTNAGVEIPKIAFVTHQPCAYCAKRMINKGGIIKIFYKEPYRIKDGLEILSKANIEVVQL
jgi:dCMP deaminase